MMRSCTGSWLALFAVLFVAACSNPLTFSFGQRPMPSFLHTRHRENLSIDPQELKNLQFYISTRVLAKDLSTPGSEGVIIVPDLTRGMATEVGPSWLRVRFSEGGALGLYSSLL